MTWQQVLQSGGKGERKAGLGFTEYDDTSLRKVTRPTRLSPEIKIAGIRVDQKMRLFGAYHDHVFYVLWFDPEHAIIPV